MAKPSLMKPESPSGADIAAPCNEAKPLPEASGVHFQQSFIDLEKIFGVMS